MIKPVRIFRKPILDMHPYAAPIEGRRKKNYLRLDFNERTIQPHPLVIKAIEDLLKEGHFQIYPEYGDINSILSQYVGVDPNQIMLTNGSDQAIDVVFRALIAEEDKVIIPSPTFPILEQSANIQGAEIISPRYKGENLDFPFEAVMENISSDIKLVVICNPNNPTATGAPKEQLKKIIQKANKVGVAVMVDEAYHEFSPKLTVSDLVKEFDNLFITRTFSKAIGVASFRAGYVISQKKNIEELTKIRGPYDVNMAAVAAVRTVKYPEVVADMKKYVSEVMQVSKPMIESFYKKNGIKFPQSVANFHLIKMPGLYEFMRDKGILIRPRSDPKGTVRVSIGTREDTRKYLEAFQEYLNLPK